MGAAHQLRVSRESSKLCSRQGIFVRTTRVCSKASISGEVEVMDNHPNQPHEIPNADNQKEQWQTQPQTAAVPGRSRAAHLLCERFIMPADGSLDVAIKL